MCGLEDGILGSLHSNAFFLSLKLFSGSFFLQLAQLWLQIDSKNKPEKQNASHIWNYFSVILSPYTFYFTTVFLLFLVTASALSFHNTTLPSWHSHSFWGCFWYFFKSVRSTYEKNYVVLQGREVKHRKKHLKYCSIIYPISGPILILLFMSWSSLWAAGPPAASKISCKICRAVFFPCY